MVTVPLLQASAVCWCLHFSSELGHGRPAEIVLDAIAGFFSSSWIAKQKYLDITRLVSYLHMGDIYQGNILRRMWLLIIWPQGSSSIPAMDAVVCIMLLFSWGYHPPNKNPLVVPVLLMLEKTACYCPYGKQSMLDSALSSTSPGISALNSSWMLGAKNTSLNRGMTWCKIWRLIPLMIINVL